MKLNTKELTQNLQLLTQLSNVVEFTSTHLRSTDNENTLIIQYTSDIDCLVDGKMLLKVLKGIKDEEVDVKVDGSLLVKSKLGKYKVPIYNETLPSLPKTIEAKQSFPNQYLPKLFNFIGTDNLRPTLASLFISDGELVGTDAHILSKISCDVSGDIMISRKSASLVSGVFGTVEASFGHDNINAHFSSDSISLYSRLTDGKYPNYKAVIPENNPNSFTFNRKEMLECLSRVSALGGNTIKFDFSDYNTIESEFGEAKELLNGEYVGEVTKIGFNHKLFSTIIRNFDEDTLTLRIGLPNKACTIQNNEMLNLIMPVVI